MPEPPKPPLPPRPPVPPKLPAPPTGPGDPGEPAPFRGPKISDPEVLRALAHPARLAVWDFLGTCALEGKDGATATEVAEVAGMTPSAMSYHLRTLAKAGFIEEAPSRGDARERVWRIGMHSFSFGAEADSPRSVKLAEAAASQALAEKTEEHFERWQARKYEMDPEIRDVAMFTQSRMRLTLEEAAEIKRGMEALMEPYTRRTFERMETEDAEDGTMIWNFGARLFPHLPE